MEPRKPKLFIFGVSSFLGYHLALNLRSHFLISGVCFKNFVTIPGAQIYPISLKNLDMMEPVARVQEPDFTINAMGITDKKFAEENLKFSDNFNMVLAVSVASLASKMKAKHIQLSCAELYDGGEAPYKEDSSDFSMDTAIGKQKITAETLIRSQTSDSNVLRIGKVMGLGHHFRTNELEKIRLGVEHNAPIYASKVQIHSYLSVKSFVNAVEMMLLGEMPNKHRTFNLGGCTLSEYEFASMWLDLMGVDKKIIKTPPDEKKRNLSMTSDNFSAAFPKWKPETKAELFQNILQELSPGLGIKKWQKTLQTL